jgi:glycosyltransferase involved in cell wall biosynthesis
MPAPPTAEAFRIAVVHDWLDTWRGGEHALAEVLALYPQADLYALVDFLPEAQRVRVLGKRARTSFLQHIPGAARHFRALLPLFPRAAESLDVSAYDLVISISHAVAKGVRTHGAQVHVCYCLSPMRYAWDLRETYLASAGAQRGPKRMAADAILNRLQRWDVAASDRVDKFIAISDFIRQRIRRCYRRDADVVYPPVDVEYFTPGDPTATRHDYFTASHWVGYKRLDLIVDAFRTMPERRLIVAGDGPELARVRAGATANVEFAGEVTRERMRASMRAARAFVFAAEEDFGIALVEAQACGTPVIAYGRGGALESIRGQDAAEPTGMFFAEQRAEAISAAIVNFEQRARPITAGACSENARSFSRALFRERFAAQVVRALTRVPARGVTRIAPC